MRLLLLALLPTAIAFKLPRWLQRGAHSHHRPTISALEALLAEQKQTEAVLLERTKQLKKRRCRGPTAGGFSHELPEPGPTSLRGGEAGSGGDRRGAAPVCEGQDRSARKRCPQELRNEWYGATYSQSKATDRRVISHIYHLPLGTHTPHCVRPKRGEIGSTESRLEEMRSDVAEARKSKVFRRIGASECSKLPAIHSPHGARRRGAESGSKRRSLG